MIFPQISLFEFLIISFKIFHFFYIYLSVSKFTILYSKRLDDIIYNKLNSLKTVEEYSKTHNNTNKNLMNHTNNTRIIDDIIDKNINTFIKSINFTNKFYSDVVQSYYNYIKTVNKFSEIILLS